MKLPQVLHWVTWCGLLGLAGCLVSSSPTSTTPTTSTDSVTGSTDAGPSVTATGSTPVTATSWPDYPDVPFVPVMTDVDGIEIPRLKVDSRQLSLTGAVPVDVDNEWAQRNPGEKATGDWISIRFNSEPKVLNPIIETSAVETYIDMYVRDGLLRQNPETFEFEPHLASRWVTEDSVKLSPDYAGKERRIALDGQPAAGVVKFDYTLPLAKDGEKEPEAPKVVFQTQGLDGKTLGNVWVGVFPVGRIVGAPTMGYHQWSDAEGRVTFSGMPTGTYEAKVGAEVFGHTTPGVEDGSLVVTPGTTENPLTGELKTAGASSLSLKPGEWIDVQRDTYYTYYLRPEAKWSDGTPFTTKDIEFGYATINNPTVDGDSFRTYYSDLVECTALSPHSVRMRYRQQYFKALEFTTSLSAICPPFHLFEKFFQADGKQLTLERLTEEQEKAQNKVSAHGATFGKFFNNDPRYNTETPLGTGPYIVGKWTHDDRLELNRNPDYWMPERAGYLDKIVVRFIPDNVTAMQAFKAGELDFFWYMTPEQYFEDLKGPPDWFKDKYVKGSWYTPMFAYFGYNMLRPQFQDRRVRIALSLLFDKQTFLERKLYDSAAIVSGPMYYFGPGYDHSVPPIGYDPEVAVDLLSEAGWVDTNNDGVRDKDGLEMKFVLPMPKGNPVAEDRVQLFQKSLKSAGIQLEIQFLEWASFIDKVKKKDFDICTLSWATPPESDPYQIFHSSGATPESRGSNHVSFDNSKADELIELMRLTLDPKKRQKMQYSFHHLIDSEQPYTFLYCVKDFGAYHKRFRGVKWYRLRPGYDLSEWYVPKAEQVHQ